MKFVLVVAVLVSCTLADKVAYKDCGSKTGRISEVDITPCPKFPCQLKRGTSVSVAVTFKSATDTKTATAVVHGKIGGIPLPFPIRNPDGCKSKVVCPVTIGEISTYQAAIDVSTSYPKVQVVVKWELRDDNNKDLFCFTVPAVIVD